MNYQEIHQLVLSEIDHQKKKFDMGLRSVTMSLFGFETEELKMLSVSYDGYIIIQLDEDIRTNWIFTCKYTYFDENNNSITIVLFNKRV